MFCKFCNHEVDLAKHIIQCPHCDGEAHEVVDHQYECVRCGRKFQQTIPEISTGTEGEEIREEYRVLTSEEQERVVSRKVSRSSTRKMT